MADRPIRVYADTSVFGGVFDDEFSRPSSAFFDQVRQGRFQLIASALIRRELAAAPVDVRTYAEPILADAVDVEVFDKALHLRDAFVSEQIVTRNSVDDALHVAIATVSSCSVIVSWNFRHIVHFDKVPLYNAVSEKNGFSPIVICSPSEVISYEDEDI